MITSKEIDAMIENFQTDSQAAKGLLKILWNINRRMDTIEAILLLTDVTKPMKRMERLLTLLDKQIDGEGK